MYHCIYECFAVSFATISWLIQGTVQNNLMHHMRQTFKTSIHLLQLFLWVQIITFISCIHILKCPPHTNYIQIEEIVLSNGLAEVIIILKVLSLDLRYNEIFSFNLQQVLFGRKMSFICVFLSQDGIYNITNILDVTTQFDLLCNTVFLNSSKTENNAFFGMWFSLAYT